MEVKSHEDVEDVYEVEDSEMSEWSDDDIYDDDLVTDDWLDAAEELIRQYKNSDSTFTTAAPSYCSNLSEAEQRLQPSANEHQQPTDVSQNNTSSFWLGYESCLHETLRYLVEVEHLSPLDPLVTGLMKHLLGQSAFTN